eukprot:1123734-Amphidinium_carterae.1
MMFPSNLTELMTKMDTQRREVVAKGVMAQKNHERIIKIFIDELKIVDELDTWNDQVKIWADDRHTVAAQVINNKVIDCLSEFKSLSGRWDIEALKVSLTECMTTLRQSSQQGAQPMVQG